MHPNTINMADYMRCFGLHVLGRAVFDATFAEMEKPFAHALSIVHAAQGAEIALKARIAQEHPLLIFDKLPKSASTDGLLSVTELLKDGQTIRYDDIPETLWATTGCRLNKAREFIEFGRLRNQIMHCLVPEGELSDKTLRFCFEVIEPVIQEFWKESLVRYAEAWDGEIHSEGYLVERLTGLGICLPKY